MRCLVFHLGGTMCGWGDAFMGTRRTTALHPSKSAVVGIIAAAMGMGREDQEAQSSLFRDYEYAVVSSGLETKIRDYHTVQTSTASEKEEIVVGGPRRWELSRGKLNTLVSEREYVCNGYYSVYVFPAADGDGGLEAMRDALERPVYTPYLGRKSCPLSYPMRPEVIEGDRAYDMVVSSMLGPFAEDIRTVSRRWSPERAHIFSTFRLEGAEPVAVEVRRDDMADRLRWQFSDRREYSYRVVV
ncbi:MAG: type I-E CRISPR-associated protein Cas5/CasD [Thermoplasmata archaeon]|nr:type I-E CRISPR-associated protein Cas5/CasD [Thermoplasmata archaeon]